MINFFLFPALPIPRFNKDLKYKSEKENNIDESIYYKFESKILKATTHLIATTQAFDDLAQEIFGPKANHKTHGVTDPAQRQIKFLIFLPVQATIMRSNPEVRF
ncbi:hypothetical protein LEP1GSC088_0849 [Leptospira interrogans str. L1207]|nr:hypothetical protein LEP1GSC088_0849 [Leptospira interrogans str. L1207]